MEQVPSSGRNTLFYIKRITGAILLLALSATFLYSAYTKSGVEFNPTLMRDARDSARATGHWLPIAMAENFFVETPKTANAFDSFQWTFLDLGINSILATGIIARLMIGLELLLGLFLLFHIYLKRFTYPAVIAVLSIFIIYLLVVILKQGNTGNCGCFGDKLAMKPLTAIWKNVVMIGATVLLIFIYPVKPYKYQEYLCLLIGLVGFSMPFVDNAMNISTQPVAYKDKPVNLDLLYKYDPKPGIELRTGKHIIAFMSLTCPHCKKAAYLLQIIHREHPGIPIFMVLNGAEEHKKEFFDETHAENVPYLYYKDTNDLIEVAGTKFPSILWVNNGKVEYKSVYAYYQLDPKFMEQWMKNK